MAGVNNSPGWCEEVRATRSSIIFVVLLQQPIFTGCFAIFASMANRCVLILLTTLKLSLFDNVSPQSEPTCEYANIQVTNQDGSSQVFTVKHLQPWTASGKHCASNRNSPVGHNYPSDSLTANKINLGSISVKSSTGKSPDLLPTVTILIGEMLSGCGKFILVPYMYVIYINMHMAKSGSVPCLLPHAVSTHC